jgi:hypothetical protein
VSHRGTAAVRVHAQCSRDMDTAVTRRVATMEVIVGQQ